MIRRQFLLASALLLAAAVQARAGDGDLSLLMFEQPGCSYCAAWNADVGPEYDLTDEGKAAPLRRVQLRDGIPEGMALESMPGFTPTFVLVREGRELARIEGYPGEDFFWGLLAAMLRDAGVTLP